MKRAAVAFLLVLAACGGGGSKEPQAAPTTSAAPATSSAPPVSPETKAVRDAVAATLAKCPCAVRVSADAYADRGRDWRETWRGVYDPASRTTTLRPDSAKQIEYRIVEDASYIKLSDGVWRRLDFSKLPAEPKSPLAALVFADPTMHFALGRTMGFATETKTDWQGTWYEAEFVPATVAPDLGALGPVLLRFFPTPFYGGVIVKNGILSTMSVTSGDDYTHGARLWIDRVGVPAPKVAAPDAKITIDVSTFTG